ncbi:uncharacterized protein METZ01_LOCUS87833 [marine metagenome]|uniref:Uncharacterized protein n=1 Tax=marine metagenome TaxID=408172 RepID=A0A381V3L7_9ZZZZ
MSKILGGTPKADPPKVDAGVVKAATAATAKKEAAAKKTAPKKAKVTKASLNKMTKAQLETWGKENLGIDIDRRKAKAALVKQLLDASK